MLDSGTKSKREIFKMNRDELVVYLELSRGMACFPDEGKILLRETALEDAGYKFIDNGIIKTWRKQAC